MGTGWAKPKKGGACRGSVSIGRGRANLGVGAHEGLTREQEGRCLQVLQGRKSGDAKGTTSGKGDESKGCEGGDPQISRHPVV